MKKRLATLVLLAGLPLAAHAAKNAVVEADEAELRHDPQVLSEVIKTVKRGTAIVVANTPERGFYKSRLPDGTLGFISGDAISIYPIGGPTAAELAELRRTRATKPVPAVANTAPATAPAPTTPAKSPYSYSGPDLGLTPGRFPREEGAPAAHEPSNAAKELDVLSGTDAPSTPVPEATPAAAPAKDAEEQLPAKTMKLYPPGPQSRNDMSDRIVTSLGAAPEGDSSAGSPAPTAPAVPDTQVQAPDTQSKSAEPESTELTPPPQTSAALNTKPEEDDLSKAKKGEIRLYGGLAPVSMGDLSSALGGVGTPDTTFQFGGEVAVPVSRDIYALFRLERQLGYVTSGAYEESVMSWPLMFGIGYNVAAGSSMRLRLSFLAGAALSADYRVTAPSVSPNSTDINTSIFAEMLKADVTFPLGKVAGLYAEGGYRFMKSGSATPQQPLGGGGAAPDPSGVYTSHNGFVPSDVDLSGPVFSVGAAFFY